MAEINGSNNLRRIYGMGESRLLFIYIIGGHKKVEFKVLSLYSYFQSELQILMAFRTFVVLFLSCNL